eukprot:m.278017 g.278017  ORF g.278017 m.278017 type:complete len:193 (-) comp54881_c1_seq19:929-1507(-)
MLLHFLSALNSFLVCVSPLVCVSKVMASCSVDKTVKIWDLRAPRVAISVQAHDADVNVLNWNRLEQHLLVSGADDGVFRIWDLRTFRTAAAGGVEPVANFRWHTAPITSVEWHPSDASVLTVAGSDNQVTIWDMAVEIDSTPGADEPNVPPQLLFIHQGQTDIKEVHWHRQMPGVTITTAESGFNFFKCISV